MRTIQETVDGDRFIELVLSEREAKAILTLHLISDKMAICGKIYHVGIRLEQQREITNASKKGCRG